MALEPTWLRTPAEVAAHRDRVDVDYVLARLPPPGGVLLDAGDAGIGKSTLIDALLKSPAVAALFALVIYIAPSRRIIGERELVREHFGSDLRGRVGDKLVFAGVPEKLCPDYKEVSRLAAAGCGDLAREQHCESCPVLANCHWPDQQRTEKLEGVRFIFAPSAYLRSLPGFVRDLAGKVGAERVLVIDDEGDSVMMPFTRELGIEALIKTLAATKMAVAVDGRADATPWIGALARLADPADRLEDLEAPYPPGHALRLAIQRRGQFMFGPKYIDVTLPAADALRCTPRRNLDGGVGYQCRPDLGGATLLVARAGLHEQVVRRRLRVPEVRELRPGIRVLHEETRLYCIQGAEGSRGHFKKNAPYILDFFSRFAALRIAAGQPVMVISKKVFVGHVVELMSRTLADLGVDVEVISDGFDRVAEHELAYVPVVNYGCRGTNDFSEYRWALCVNSFNCHPDVFDRAVEEAAAPGEPITAHIATIAGGRRAVADGAYNVATRDQGLVERLLFEGEGAVVEQVALRIRFTTKPRGVVFFTWTPLSFPMTKTFGSVAAARREFGIPNRREEKRDATRDAVRAAQAAGCSKREAARRTGLSRRTVDRYWKSENQIP